MNKIIKFESFLFLRQPIWLILFAFSIIVSIFLSRDNFTSFSDIPSMVYFVMVANLLFMLYGAEEARSDRKHHLTEQLAVLPLINRYRIGKLLYWCLLAFIYYLAFYVTLVSFLHFYTEEKLTVDVWRETSWYTIFVWFLPFYFSIMIGYVVFTLIPHITSYIVLVFIWFMVMPYNSMLGVIPASIGAWMINGDPNIGQVISTYKLELMKINNGYFVQRIMMLLFLWGCYYYVKPITYTGKWVLPASIAMIVGVPLLSPYHPQIDNQEAIYLRDYVYVIPHDVPADNLDYQLDHYEFSIHHLKDMHELKYKVEFEIDAVHLEVTLALWDEFAIRDVLFNKKPIPFKQKDDAVYLQLPNKKGIIEISAGTDTFLPIGPTTYELVATSPWYPMNPLEAADPFHQGKKEQYTITANASRNMYSNLPKTGDKTWEGVGYGPTLVKGGFIQTKERLYPAFKDVENIDLNIKRIREQVDQNNQKLDADLQLSCRSFLVLTLYPAFQANPEECYLYEDENFSQFPNIFSNLFIEANDTYLFEAFYYDFLASPSWQHFLKKRYPVDKLDEITSMYQTLESEQKLHLIKKWYKDTGGKVSPEQMIKDLRDLHVRSE